MAAITGPLVSFDRTVSATLEGALLPGGELEWLMDALSAAPVALDVQLRADSRRSHSWVSVYAGLTSVLDVHESGGQFRLEAHTTHRVAAGFHSSWRSAQPAAALTKARSRISEYLTRILAPGAVDVRYTGREGRVQTLISTAASDAFGVLQREAVPAFTSAPLRDRLVDPLKQRILSAVAPGPQPPAWWPGVRDRGAPVRLGLETDLMGIDHHGRLLVIEVKPADTVEGITWAPGQARLYAEVFALWLELDPHVWGAGRDGRATTSAVASRAIVGVARTSEDPRRASRRHR